MGAEHRSTSWSEVARVAEEYVDRGLLDEEVEREVAALLEAGRSRRALEVALEHYRESRHFDGPTER